MKRTVVLFFFLALGLLSSFLSANARGAVPILQGATSAWETQFTVLRKSDSPPVYEVAGPESWRRKVTPMETLTYPGSAFAVDKLWLDGLRPGVQYTLNVFDRTQDQAEHLEDSRTFETIAEQKENAIRFVMASCMPDQADLFQAAMWRAVRDVEPQMIFFIGDNVYADVGSDGTTAGIWKRYVETRLALEVFYFSKLIPIVATWDDHDYGKNNADETFPLKEETRRTFKAFFGNYPVRGYETGPGVASVFQVRGHRFFLMDDRTYRSPENRPQGSHWGKTQEDWFFSRLSSRILPTFLFNGSMFFGAYARDEESFERQHPESFEALLGRLRDFESPVVFGSGDVHYSELMRIEPELLGYETAELVSSSMHSLTYPGVDWKASNPRRVRSTWKHNFLVVDSKSKGSTQMEFDVRSVGGDLETIFEEHFSIRSR